MWNLRLNLRLTGSKSACNRTAEALHELFSAWAIAYPDSLLAQDTDMRVKTDALFPRRSANSCGMWLGPHQPRKQQHTTFAGVHVAKRRYIFYMFTYMDTYISPRETSLQVAVSANHRCENKWLRHELESPLRRETWHSGHEAHH